VSDRERQPAIRAAYAAAAAGFVAYAVWGSLFPFDFHAVPMSQAAALFWTRWASDAGPWSLTDLLSNVLLFLPIGLLLSAARGQTRTPGLPATLAAPLLTIAFATALSVVIEFAQAFVSWRTPSIVDVAAEVAGAACGIAIWRLMSRELDRVLATLVGTVRRSTRLEQILLACCAGFAVAWLLPADFTLRPSEIGDKYAHKRLLLPFVTSPDAATRGELAAIACAAVPLGLAAVVCGYGTETRRSAVSGALIAAVALTALEAVQVPVFSRTTDANELLAAIGGSTLGASAGATFDRPRIAAIDWRVMRMAAAAMLWVCAVMAFEWWPFHVALDPSRLHYETAAWSRAPFRWPAAIGDAVPGAVLAALAGWFVGPRLNPHFARLQTMALIGFAGAVFAVCEAGRIVFAAGRPTLLSAAFELSALGAGLYLGSSGAGDLALRSRGATRT
jgi:glycopeptide antibiotics resistance protein